MKIVKIPDFEKVVKMSDTRREAEDEFLKALDKSISDYRKVCEQTGRPPSPQARDIALKELLELNRTCLFFEQGGVPYLVSPIDSEGNQF